VADGVLVGVRDAGPQDAGSPRRAGEVALTWLGHATVLLELDGGRVITDPLLRGHVGPLVRVAPPAPMPEPVDCVLLSHLHPAHADLPTLRTLIRTGPLLVPRRSAAWLTGKGLTGVREMAPAQTTGVGDLTVRATRARHDGRRRAFGPTAEPIGFLVQSTVSVYFAGNTKAFAEMADLRGHVDVALVSVADCHSVRRRDRFTPEEAAATVALINPEVAVPIHWGTLSLGGAPRAPSRRCAPAREFAVHVRRYAPHVRICILEPSQRIVL
jgi:L-ascorbate metabolism protein UlaG (beta-lactamase superfamily)